MKTLSVIITVLFLSTSCGGSSDILETKQDDVSSTKQTTINTSEAGKQSIEDAIAEQKKLGQGDSSPLGTWQITTETPRGDRTGTLTITEEDGKLKGKTDNGSFTITQKGNKLSWTSNMDTPMGAMELQNEVEINGDNMSGNVKMSSGPAAGRSMKLTGIRK